MSPLVMAEVKLKIFLSFCCCWYFDSRTTAPTPFFLVICKNPHSTPLGSNSDFTFQERKKVPKAQKLEEMEKTIIAVCVGVGFLGVLSAALGFGAEAEKIKVSDVHTTINGGCSYPRNRSPAVALGVASSVALVMAHAIINTVAGCICCMKQPHPSGRHWTIALVSFVISWTTFIMAFLLLLMGAALNDQRGQERSYFGNDCYVVKPGVFSGGAILSLTSISFAIIYHTSLLKVKTMGMGSSSTTTTACHQGIAMGQPHIPPQSSQPVFVQEDTYNRQQHP